MISSTSLLGYYFFWCFSSDFVAAIIRLAYPLNTCCFASVKLYSSLIMLFAWNQQAEMHELLINFSKFAFSVNNLAAISCFWYYCCHFLIFLLISYFHVHQFITLSFLFDIFKFLVSESNEQLFAYFSIQVYWTSISLFARCPRWADRETKWSIA